MAPSFRLRLLALTLLALIVRLAWVRLEPTTNPVADENMWLSWGAGVLTSPEVRFSPFELRFIFHPPLYLYLIGVCAEWLGEFSALRDVQAVLGATLPVAVALLGRRLANERTGLVAGLFAALYPELVWFVSHYWAESVFAVLLWWGFERLSAADQRGSWLAAAAAGLLLGLAVLTRETVLYFLPLAAGWLAWRRGSAGLRRAAILLLLALLVVAPWTIRNYLVFQAFVPVSTAGGLNLWQGNTRASRQQVYEEYWSIHGRIAKYQHARRKGIEAVLERQPWWLFEKLRAELPEYWAVHGQPVVHLERGAYPEVSRPWALAGVAVVLAPYLALLVLFVAGIVFLPRNRTSALLLGFLVFYVLLHVVAHGYPRYRLPSLPVLFLLGAHGLLALLRRPRPASSPGCRLAAAATAVVLAASIAPSLQTWVTRPWPPPWFESEAEAGEAGRHLDREAQEAAR